jgi:choline dehydrogenase-like flavoprotein
MAESTWEVLVVGGGLAGLSAAIYLGRALRRTLVVDSGKSLAQWEPEVQNYLGFPAGIGGSELLELGRHHALQFQAALLTDEITEAQLANGLFCLKGRKIGERRLSNHGARLVRGGLCDAGELPDDHSRRGWRGRRPGHQPRFVRGKPAQPHIAPFPRASAFDRGQIQTLNIRGGLKPA